MRTESALGMRRCHNVTGVLPAYRGRGIAMVLKIATMWPTFDRDV